MIKNKTNVFKNIEKLGLTYSNEFLVPLDKQSLSTNWWEALKFFFDHSFARGRSDELSIQYINFTIEALEEYLSINTENIEQCYLNLKDNTHYLDSSKIIQFKSEKKVRNCINHPEFKLLAVENPILKILTTKRQIKGSKKYVYLNNDADVLMVFDVLKLILDDNKKNIYNYIISTIQNKNTQTIYDELISLRSVGDKIASFVIRDIGLMNPGIIMNDYEHAFPVDTWVAKLAIKLGCNGEYTKIKNCLIDECLRNDIEPLKFAAGMWYLGTHSFDILIEHFGEINL
ncbi:MAG: hypothetical protein B655_2270 [Methanobacterium sp. Maddingley MBC34]|nr:MAG: hypothetical protein B655_2270 [Methanobacterium sp. Maddingley MBC34]